MGVLEHHLEVVPLRQLEEKSGAGSISVELGLLHEELHLYFFLSHFVVVSAYIEKLQVSSLWSRQS
jgi:hypothetical protein